MKNDWQRVEGGMPLMEGKEKLIFSLWDGHQKKSISITRDFYQLTQKAEPEI